MTTMTLSQLIVGTVQGAVLILLAPGILGLLRKIKARCQMRQGPDILQPYRDLSKLLGRPAVRSAVSSPVFAVTPLIIFAAYSSLAWLTDNTSTVQSASPY